MTDERTNFPYNTLIWAALAAISIFLFKPQIEDLLTDAEHINVFGIEIKTNKAQAIKLKDSIHQFEVQIASLSTQINTQQDQIQVLAQLSSKLKNDLAECPKASDNVLKYNEQLSTLFKASKALKAKSDDLKDLKIIKTSPVLNIKK